MSIKQILFSIVVIATIVACSKGGELDANLPELTPADALVEETENVRLLYSDSAITKVQVTGPLMLNHTERNRLRKEFPKGIRVEFYDEQGAISSVLTAKHAIQYEMDDRIIARDSVVWKSADKRMLETSELIWDEREQLIYTNKFSVITAPRDTIFTQYFEATQDFSKIKMTSTDGTIIVDDFSNSDL
ncbi:MAG: LPS export ABC transporter periplasmic protein LptC [Bacteroidota bacterium]